MIARWMIIGFVLWLGVTVSFRVLGNMVGAEAEVLAWMPIVLPFVVFVITYMLLTILKVERVDRAEVTGIMVIPGLLFGIYEINSFSFVFPDLDPSQSPAFATLMYSSYAAAILAGVLSSRLKQSDADTQ